MVIVYIYTLFSKGIPILIFRGLFNALKALTKTYEKSSKGSREKIITSIDFLTKTAKGNRKTTKMQTRRLREWRKGNRFSVNTS